MSQASCQKEIIRAKVESENRRWTRSLVEDIFQADYKMTESSDMSFME
jgi:hypothetical protein